MTGAAAALVGSAASLLLAAQTLAPPAAPAPTGPRLYVGAFCLPVAGGYVDAEYPRFLSEWGARPANSAEGAAARPERPAPPGQMLRFPEAAAPVAFVDIRRDVCSLVYPGPVTPAAALAELKDGRPPVGPGGAPAGWRRIVVKGALRPEPPRWLLPIGGAQDRGVCAERFEDLARHDGAAVSMLQLSPCRLAEGETTVDG